MTYIFTTIGGNIVKNKGGTALKKWNMGIDHQNEILKFTTTEEIKQNGQNRQA